MVGGRLLRRAVLPIVFLVAIVPGAFAVAPPAPALSWIYGRVDAAGGKINLQWGLSTGATDYQIYRATFSGLVTSKSVVATVVGAGSTYQDVGLTNGSTYYYHLVARNTLQEGATSAFEAYGKARPNSAPGMPAMVSVPVDGSTVTVSTFTMQMVSSDPDGDGLAYLISFSTASDMSAIFGVASSSNSISTFTPTPALTLNYTFFAYTSPLLWEIPSGSTATFTQTPFILLYFKDQTTYYWRAVAGDGVANSGASAISSFYLKAPPVVTSVSPSSVVGTAASTITVSGYNFRNASQVKLTDGAQTLLTGPTVTMTFEGYTESLALTVPSGVVPGTYGFTIVAPPGTSTSGNLLTVTGSAPPPTGADTTPPAAPTNLNGLAYGTGPGGAYVGLWWFPNLEADLQDYRVQRATSTSGAVVGSTWTSVVGTVVKLASKGGPTFFDGALTAEATYYYSVTARDTSNNESGASSQISLKASAAGIFAQAGIPVSVAGAGSAVFLLGGATVPVSFSGLPTVSMSFSTGGVFNMAGLNFAAIATSATITLPGMGITIPNNLFPGVTNATMKVSTNPALSPINPQVPTVMAAANQMQSQGNAQQAMPQPIDGGQREISWFDDTGEALAEAAQKGIAEIKIFYPDANNDKRIDGTKGFQTRGTGPQAVAMRNIFGHDFPPEDVEADDTHMIGCYLKGTGKLGQWSDPFPTKVDTVNKCMVFKTQHFSVFTIMAAAPAVNLDGLMVYPNPYNPTSAPISDIDPAINGTLKFQGLTADAKIRIFNLTGELVVEMAPGYAAGKATSPGAGRAEWDGLNADGEAVARGLYFYIVDSSTGRKRGKIAVLK